jgi:hypothetical protein
VNVDEGEPLGSWGRDRIVGMESNRGKGRNRIGRGIGGIWRSDLSDLRPLHGH